MDFINIRTLYYNFTARRIASRHRWATQGQLRKLGVNHYPHGIVTQWTIPQSYLLLCFASIALMSNDGRVEGLLDSDDSRVRSHRLQ